VKHNKIYVLKYSLLTYLTAFIFYFCLLSFAIFINCTFNIEDCYSQWITQNSGTTQHLYDVYFINTQTGWACGDNGTILKTTNAGNDWFGQNSGTTYQLYSIHFIDPNIGFCAARVGYSIYKTTNGGNNFFSILSTNKAFESVYFIDSLRGWASGTYNGAWVFRTTNGGVSWDSVIVNSGTGYHVYFINLLLVMEVYASFLLLIKIQVGF